MYVAAALADGASNVAASPPPPPSRLFSPGGENSELILLKDMPAACPLAFAFVLAAAAWEGVGAGFALEPPWEAAAPSRVADYNCIDYNSV